MAITAHKTKVVTAFTGRRIGTDLYRAECECGWVAPKHEVDYYRAQRIGHAHEQEVANAEQL